MTTYEQGLLTGFAATMIIMGFLVWVWATAGPKVSLITNLRVAQMQRNAAWNLLANIADELSNKDELIPWDAATTGELPLTTGNGREAQR